MKRLVLLFVCAAAFLAAAPAYAEHDPNPFGTMIVRFGGGTSRAQMTAAVAKAGGNIVTDLSPLGALAVSPVTADFATRAGADPRVTSVFREPAFDGPVTLDGKDGGGAVGSPDVGKSPSFPDPWHDASSFLGVTNPEVVMQVRGRASNCSSRDHLVRFESLMRVNACVVGHERIA